MSLGIQAGLDWLKARVHAAVWWPLGWLHRAWVRVEAEEREELAALKAERRAASERGATP